MRCETEKWRDVNQGNDINLHYYLHFFWVVAEIVALDVIENRPEISSIFCTKEKENCCLVRTGTKQGKRMVGQLSVQILCPSFYTISFHLTTYNSQQSNKFHQTNLQTQLHYLDIQYLQSFVLYHSSWLIQGK